jgi:hypothetical protein
MSAIAGRDSAATARANRNSDRWAPDFTTASFLEI